MEPLSVRLYFRSVRGLLTLHRGLRACAAGFWLGALSRSALHRIDQSYYDACRQYFEPEYNRRGLWKWEEAAICDHFGGCRRLLVGAAGGGREVLALARLGYTVEGFECHPVLAEGANVLLAAEGVSSRVRTAPRDGVPPLGRRYDGLIVGWGGYMLIRGSARRIGFLRALRGVCDSGAPLLLSFFARTGTERRFRLIHAIASVTAALARNEPIDPGDTLEPNYVHYFTREQIAGELAEAGFRLCEFGTNGYGHAVAVAEEPENRTWEPHRRPPHAAALTGRHA